MDVQNEHLHALEDIKQMMHKSSRFVSLSGWSGVAAGICALAGAWVAKVRIERYFLNDRSIYSHYERGVSLNNSGSSLSRELFITGILTFVAAFILAFVFTYLRSKKNGIPVWGFTARRVMINVAVPMLAGGILVWRMTEFGFYGLIAPACLLFYGLALINASKYTLPEIRYLGFSELVLGIINLWVIGYGLYFWAIGFGILHIIYGIVMWNRYERQQ